MYSFMLNIRLFLVLFSGIWFWCSDHCSYLRCCLIMWPDTAFYIWPYGSIQSPLSYSLLCITLEPLGLTRFKLRKISAWKTLYLVCNKQFTVIAQKLTISLLIIYIEFLQKFVCINHGVYLLFFLLFMVSEIEYFNFISMAIIPGE